MNIRKNRNLGIVFVICGAAIIVLSVMVGRPLLTVCGGLIVIFGIPYMTGMMFTLDIAKKTITVYALLGPVKKEYPFQSIACREGSVFISMDGAEKKLPLSKGICEREDWEKFVEEVSKGEKGK